MFSFLFYLSSTEYFIEKIRSQDGPGKNWASGRILCIVSFLYSENYCNVLTPFSVTCYFLSGLYVGQIE